MENRILVSTKKVLGISADYTAFDLDVMTHINSAFSILHQIGIGPDEGFYIEDDSAGWDDFNVPQPQLNLVRSYIYLKARILFDPPTTSFVIEAMEKQIAEFESRLSGYREAPIGEALLAAKLQAISEEDVA